MNGMQRTSGWSRNGWLAAYTAAFVEIAVSRGWRRENAETWPVGIGDEAFFEAYRFNWDPRRAAAEDVVFCEEPPSLSY